MAENPIIAATISVDTGNSNANVAGLNKETSALKGNLKDVGATVKGAGAETSVATGNFKNLKEQLLATGGPTKALTGGLGGLNAAFNLLKANPIIGVFALLAGLVVALFQKFKSMEGASDAIGKAFGKLSGIFEFFMNKILGPLIEAFSTLLGWITDSITFIADIFSPGIAEVAERMGDLTEALDDLNDAEAQSAITRAESNRKLQEARDIAQDANVPIKDRIAALKEAGKIENEEFANSIRIATERARIMLEQIGLELNVRKELIDSIRNGSIESLKAARNEIFAMKEVDKEKLKAIDALIIQAEDQGAERARVNKKTESQITALEREEAAKRKEARDKANADAKAAQQKLNEFNNKLRQAHQETELLSIKDAHEKELRQLEIKIENEKKLNEDAVKSGALTRKQADLLLEEVIKQGNIKRQDLIDKHEKEVTAKETEFQNKLAKIRQETMLACIVDTRKLEEEQLRISYEAALAEAEKQYATDAQKLTEFKTALDEKNRQDRLNLQRKNAEEDRKIAIENAQKMLDDGVKDVDKIISDPESEFEAKRAAVDAELVLVQSAFDQKLLLEEDYNNRVEELAEKRKTIAELETAHKKAQIKEVGTTLTALTELVGKQTVAGKALGIATALINTYQGASEVIKQKSTLPSPADVIAKVAGVAAVVAMGIKTVKAITAVQVPGGGGGGQGVSAPTISAPAAPIAPTQVGTQIDPNVVGGTGNATVRAYVLDSDVQNNRERNERLNRAARLGG